MMNEIIEVIDNIDNEEVAEDVLSEATISKSASKFWKRFDAALDWLYRRIFPFVFGVLSAFAAAMASGCSGLTPTHKTQTMGVYAMGLPAVAIITQTTQNADNSGEDSSTATQSNPVTVETTLKTGSND